MEIKQKWIRIFRLLLPAIAVLLVLPGVARADFHLWDWSVRVDGSTYDLFTPYSGSAVLPPNVDGSAFDFGAGMVNGVGIGTIVMSFTTPGPHDGGVYLYNFYDHGSAIDRSTAYGTVGGAPPAGVSYEMNWPGMLNPSAPPTVFDDFAANSLSNTDGVPAYSGPSSACCSVATALIHSFTLAAGETGVLTFMVSPNAPAGFYLQETDHDANASIYLSQSLTINGGGAPAIPEPGTVWLLMTVCAGAWYGARRRRKTS